MAGIKNIKFKDGVTCPIFIKSVMDAINPPAKESGTTFGTRRVAICPVTNREVVQEFIGVSSGDDQWDCLHNPHNDAEADAMDVAAFKKLHKL